MACIIINEWFSYINIPNINISNIPNIIISNISAGIKNLPILNGEILPILNGESLYDVLYGVLGKYPDSIKWISIVFICSDDSIRLVSESVEFNTACLFNE